MMITNNTMDQNRCMPGLPTFIGQHSTAQHKHNTSYNTLRQDTHPSKWEPQYTTHHASVLRACNKLLNGCLRKCLMLFSVRMSECTSSLALSPHPPNCHVATCHLTTDQIYTHITNCGIIACHSNSNLRSRKKVHGARSTTIKTNQTEYAWPLDIDHSPQSKSSIPLLPFSEHNPTFKMSNSGSTWHTFKPRNTTQCRQWQTRITLHPLRVPTLPPPIRKQASHLACQIVRERWLGNTIYMERTSMNVEWLADGSERLKTDQLIAYKTKRDKNFTKLANLHGKNVMEHYP